MVQSVEILVDIDDTNKIYYTEDKSFAANDRKAINQAFSDYAKLRAKAKANGYQIIKRERNITPMDGGLMTKVNEKIRKIGTIQNNLTRK